MFQLLLPKVDVEVKLFSELMKLFAHFWSGSLPEVLQPSTLFTTSSSSASKNGGLSCRYTHKNSSTTSPLPCGAAQYENMANLAHNSALVSGSDILVSCF